MILRNHKRDIYRFLGMQCKMLSTHRSQERRVKYFSSILSFHHPASPHQPHHNGHYHNESIVIEITVIHWMTIQRTDVNVQLAADESAPARISHKLLSPCDGDLRQTVLTHHCETTPWYPNELWFLTARVLKICLMRSQTLQYSLYSSRHQCLYLDQIYKNF